MLPGLAAWQPRFTSKLCCNVFRKSFLEKMILMICFFFLMVKQQVCHVKDQIEPGIFIYLLKD